jgi:hypothetical protein
MPAAATKRGVVGGPPALAGDCQEAARQAVQLAYSADRPFLRSSCFVENLRVALKDSAVDQCSSSQSQSRRTKLAADRSCVPTRLFSSALRDLSALADLRAQGLAGTSTAVQLPNAVRHESTREARYKDGRGCYGDQVDAPGVVASTYKIEMSGVGFVSIRVKAHGAASFCAVRANLTGRLPKGSSADRHGPPLVGSAPTNGG